MESLELHAIVHGRVQGVFFRVHTREQALELGLSGWVRNNPDGTVELIAQGDKKSLVLLNRWLKRGPPYANVEEVISDYNEVKKTYSNFEIVRY